MNSTSTTSTTPIIPKEERLPPEVIEKGDEFSSLLYNAKIMEALGTEVEIKAMRLDLAATKNGDIVEAYLDEEIESIEALYIAVERFKKEI